MRRKFSARECCAAGEHSATPVRQAASEKLHAAAFFLVALGGGGASHPPLRMRSDLEPGAIFRRVVCQGAVGEGTREHARILSAGDSLRFMRGESHVESCALSFRRPSPPRTGFPYILYTDNSRPRRFAAERLCMRRRPGAPVSKTNG